MIQKFLGNFRGCARNQCHARKLHAFSVLPSGGNGSRWAPKIADVAFRDTPGRGLRPRARGLGAGGKVVPYLVSGSMIPSLFWAF